MTIDFDKPVQTRDGRKVRIVDTNLNGCRLVGIISNNTADNAEWVAIFNNEGRYYSGKAGFGYIRPWEEKLEHPCDLINVPAKPREFYARQVKEVSLEPLFGVPHFPTKKETVYWIECSKYDEGTILFREVVDE